MKRFTFALLIFTVLILAGAFLQKGKADTSRRHEAVVEFPETAKLMGVLLKGQYLMVHDESKMAEGLPCLYVYAMKDGKTDGLVTSFHCIHIDRPKADRFLVTMQNRTSPYEVLEIQEIQFAGTTDGHGVPK